MRPRAAMPPEPPPRSPATEASQLVHDLRNKLNSLVMNSGVLASKLADDETAQRFAAQIERDGQASSELLARITDLIKGNRS